MMSALAFWRVLGSTLVIGVVSVTALGPAGAATAVTAPPAAMAAMAVTAVTAPPVPVVMPRDGNLVSSTGTRAVWSSRTSKQAFAIGRFPVYGWSQAQWPCLNQLWQHESGWNERAGNPRTGAYGIPQAYPAIKMAVDGADYLTNPRTQIHWGEDYIYGRYRTPCAAWAFELARGWY